MDEEIIVLILVNIIHFCYMIVFDGFDLEEIQVDEDLPNLIEISRKRSFHKPNRIENYVENVVWNYTPGQFQQNFRLTWEAFDE